jgi:hypothetical protein
MERIGAFREVLQLSFPGAMRVSRHGLTILLIVQLAGCTLHNKKQAAAPPPPKPAAVAPPAPEPQQLSVPQTSVVLPSPQPVNPDAIPPVKAAAPATDRADAPSVSQRIPHRTSRPATAEAEPETEAPAAAAAEQPAFQAILSPEEQKRIAGNIETRKKEINERLERAKRLPGTNQSLVERIHSFVAQSDGAQQRGDYTQADSLSERALILARELSE